jgi:hypothetical protein
MRGLGGEAYQRDAIAKALRLLNLEVDEESKGEIVDDPPAAYREGSEGTQVTHIEVLHT